MGPTFIIFPGPHEFSQWACCQNRMIICQNIIHQTAKFYLQRNIPMPICHSNKVTFSTSNVYNSIWLYIAICTYKVYYTSAPLYIINLKITVELGKIIYTHIIQSRYRLLYLYSGFHNFSLMKTRQ